MKGRGRFPCSTRRRSCARSARDVETRDRAGGGIRAVSSSVRRWRRSSGSSPSTWACEHVVGVANGTDALTIALTAWAWARATTWSCRRSRSTRAPRRFPTPGRGRCSATSTPRRSASRRRPSSAALTPATRAVIAVDLFGRDGAGRRAARAARRPRRRGARGRRAGGRRATATDAAPGRSATSATFSFFPSKNLFCLGDGGAIATDDAAVAEQARMLRFHGSRDKSTLRGGGVELAARRAAGRGAARDPAAARRVERAPPRAGRRLCRGGRRGRVVAAGAARPARSPCTTCS